ncbi:MAG: hypothetical protein ACI8ZM_005155 [Crocinitomix sp.]|jgi:hypothetical protein
MIFKYKTKLKLGIMLFCASAFGANAQYNSDYKIAQYQDEQTIESNVDIGENEIITVGTILVYDDGQWHKDIILTRLDKKSNVIWNIKYGEKDINEIGNGITLSWDQKHVIVVGSFQKDPSIPEDEIKERYALVMKVQISDGAVVWNTLHGNSKYDDQAFLVKKGTGIDIEKSYIIVGRSDGDEDQSYERMYAFKIKESGDEIWTRRYYLNYNFPISAIHVTSMVENRPGKFLVAGTRHEVNRPTQIFTIGFRTSDGAVTEDLFHYPTNNVYHVSTVDIDREPEGKGYALSFTANDLNGDCVEEYDLDKKIDRIGVIRLNEDRKVLWSKIYWEKEATNHNGLSIRFYKDELHVCVNINRKDRYNTAGFLRVKEADGGFIYCNTYHVPETLFDYGPIGNHMIRSNDDKAYYVKSIYAKRGFAMTKTNVIGESVCDKKTELKECKIKVDLKDEKCEAKEYGKYFFNDIPLKKVEFSVDPCDELDGLAPEGDDGQGSIGSPLPINKAIIYPSPVSENQEIINLQFITDMDEAQGNVAIYNSMGQLVANYDLMFINGENKFEFDANQFPSGMYMVTITAQGEMLDRVKFIKN